MVLHAHISLWSCLTQSKMRLFFKTPHWIGVCFTFYVCMKKLINIIQQCLTEKSVLKGESDCWGSTLEAVLPQRADAFQPKMLEKSLIQYIIYQGSMQGTLAATAYITQSYKNPTANNKSSKQPSEQTPGNECNFHLNAPNKAHTTGPETRHLC